MDSCYLFNFLFGPRKATSELSKAFSALGRKSNNNTQRKTGANSRPSKSSFDAQNHSPLKQLQVKLASYAKINSTGTTISSTSTSTSNTSSNSTKKSNNNNHNDQNESVEAIYDRKSGCYKAILVKSKSYDDDIEDDDDNIYSYTHNYDNDDHDINYNVHSHSHSQFYDAIIDSKQTTDTHLFDSQLVCDVSRTQIKTNSDHFHDQWLDSMSSDVTTKQPESIDGQSSLVASLNSATQNGQPAIVMYSNESDDSLVGSDLDQSHRPPIVSYAEVYNLVSAGGESRMKLVQVNSFNSSPVTRDQNNNHNIECSKENSKDQTNTFVNRTSNNYNARSPIRSQPPVRGMYVKRMVQSLESNQSFDDVDSLDCSSSTFNDLEELNLNSMDPEDANNPSKAAIPEEAPPRRPVKLVKPLAPPELAPKSLKARYIQAQLRLNKPTKLSQLFADEAFLVKFFGHLDPLDRCEASTVCSQWRNILYSNPDYWKDLILVIDYSQLRREHLVECIISTLQSTARMRHQRNGASNNHSKQQQQQQMAFPTSTSASEALELRHSSMSSDSQLGESTRNTESLSDFKRTSIDSNSLSLSDIEQEDLWRIQEFCNKQAARAGGNYLSARGTQMGYQTNTCEQTNILIGNQQQNDDLQSQQQHHHQPEVDQNNNNNNDINSQVEPSKQRHSASQSSSIPSQISSTFSSVSLSSMLMHPIQEPSQIENIKHKLYASIETRGLKAICISGATNEDIEDLVAKLSPQAKLAIVELKLINAFVHDKAITLVTETFINLQRIEISGCNEISNNMEISMAASHIEHLVIGDCIHVGDNIGPKLEPLLRNLRSLTIQSYHLTDVFTDFLASHYMSLAKLTRLELPSCKEITNKSLVSISKYLTQLEHLSVSYSRITDEGIDILASRGHRLACLDLSWCSYLTDASLEILSIRLANSLEELVLDRVVQITDRGLMHLARIRRLRLLDIRWCHRITDVSLEFLISNLKHLKYLSIAGLDQITSRSLLALPMSKLLELELTNCSAVNNEVRSFLSERMPNCNIVC